MLLALGVGTTKFVVHLNGHEKNLTSGAIEKSWETRNDHTEVSQPINADNYKAAQVRDAQTGRL